MTQTTMYLNLSDLALCNGHRVTVDCETTGLNWWEHQIIGVGIHCPDVGVSGYIPTLNSYHRNMVAKIMQDTWKEGTTVCAHNLKFDFHFLGIRPADVPWTLIDTTILVHLLDSRYKKAAPEVEKIFLGTDTKKSFRDRAPRGVKTKIWEWPTPLVAEYCVNDVRIEHEFGLVLEKRVADKLGLPELFIREMEYLSCIWDIERRGIKLDVPFLEDAQEFLIDAMGMMEKELYDGVGYEFNWRSHKQLSKALYEDMGFTKPVNPYPNSLIADRGKYNETMTSTFILMEKAKHPLGEIVSLIRETKKMIEYCKKWIGLADSDNVIHTNFNLTGTRTGRLSSSKPNIQNTPSEYRNRFTQSVYTGTTERQEAYNLRQAYVSRPGFSFVGVDWRQMEMRMFGILSADPHMIQSLQSGTDVHADVAERIWGSRDPLHREWAKTIGFGLIYGMTIGSVEMKLDMTRAQAKEIAEDYWAAYPNIRPWMEEVKVQVETEGYIRYWDGRRWHEDNRQFSYRGANATIQGGCAGVLREATLRVAARLREEMPQAQVINLVHDELIVEVPDELIGPAVKLISETMQVEDLFDIPWFTDSKVGKSYGTMEQYESDHIY